MDRKSQRGRRGEFVDEHIASRKDWGAYLDVTTTLHRAAAGRADTFLVEIRTRLERALTGGTRPHR